MLLGVATTLAGWLAWQSQTYVSSICSATVMYLCEKRYFVHLLKAILLGGYNYPYPTKVDFYEIQSEVRASSIYTRTSEKIEIF